MLQQPSTITTDEAAVQALYQRLMDGWNDGNAFAAPFTEDGDLVAFDGTHFKGRSETVRFHQRLFRTYLKGTRLIGEGKLTVTDGPFSETKELIGGYSILQAKSKKEAIELGKRFIKIHADILGPSYEGELEIRQLYESSDFGVEFTPELREQEERIRAQTDQMKK